MRTVISLNRKWAFSKQAESVPTEVSNKWDFVNLPHSWNAIDGQDGDNDFYRGTAYYAKSIKFRYRRPGFMSQSYCLLTKLS